MLSWFPDTLAHSRIDYHVHLTRLGGVFIIWNASLRGHNDRCVVRRTIARNRCRGESLICQQLRCMSGGTHPHQEKKKKESEKKEHLFPWSQFPCQTEHLSVFCVWNKQDLHTLKNNVKSSKGGELRILTWVNKRGLLIGRPSLGFTWSVSLGPGVMCGFDSLPLCFHNLVWNVAQS